MSTKFTLKVVQVGLRKHADEDITQKALAEMQRLAAEEAASKPERPPAEKKLLSIIRPVDTTEIAWIVSHPEEMPPAEIPGKIREAAATYNTTRKGRKAPAKSLGQAMELVPAKIFKEFRISVRTKLPVTMLAMAQDVQIPCVEAPSAVAA